MKKFTNPEFEVVKLQADIVYTSGEGIKGELEGTLDENWFPSGQ